MEPKLISSVQNPLVKKILLLKEKSRERKKTGLFVVEGQRELELAQKGGYVLKQLLYCPEINSHVKPGSNVETIQLSKPVYEKVAHRGTTEGILGILEAKDHSLDNIHFKTKKPLVLVAEAPEKPGNIGALLRTADAAAVDAVLIANPKSDLYNPNIVRSSVGCVFTNQIGMGSTEQIIQFLKSNQIKIYCAALSASKNYVECDFTAASAIVMGTEATGLTESWLRNSDQNIIIPMQGEIDSMNVSVSAAILIFEAKRQRGF
jgi:TrmH family RNA methyltransferase